MAAAFYADYVRVLKARFDELDADPDKFHSFDLHIDLAHKGLLFVYETRRKQGVTNSIYYARMASTGTNKQVSQKTAHEAVGGFFGLGQFLALSGDAGAATADEAAATAGYPTCAVAFTYRKTGMPEALSMRMIFLGFGSDGDASAHAQMAPATLVNARPFHSERLWEWK